MFRFFWGRLQNRMIFVFVLIWLVPNGIIGYSNLRITSDTLIQKIGGEELNNLAIQANTLERRMTDLRDDLIFLSAAPPTQHYAEIIKDQSAPDSAVRADQLLLFKAFLGRTANPYQDVRLIDLRGEELIRIDASGSLLTPDKTEIKQAGQAYFNQAIGLPPNEVYISDVDLNRTNGLIDTPPVPIVYYSIPIRVEGVPVAVLTAKIRLEPLFRDTLARNTEPLYLVDRDGSYLLNPDPRKLYGTIFKTGLSFDALPSARDGIDMFAKGQGVIQGSPEFPNALPVFVRFKPETLSRIHWLLIRAVPLDDILGEVNKAQGIVILVSLVSLFILIPVGVFIIRGIVRPIRELADAADTIQQGNWDTSLPYTGQKNEIGDLARTFDRMVGELRSAICKLEARLVSRSTELEAANIKLSEAQRRVEEASRAKSLFLSKMGHELRTPLNVIIGYANSMRAMPEMFNNTPLPAVYQPYVKLIEDNGHYLTGLLNDLFDLNKEAQARRVDTASLDSQAFRVFGKSTLDPSGIHSILLVEDEASMRELLRRALENAGYLVVDTSDGAQVLDLAVGMLPNLIILDVTLPHLNGWELMRQLHIDPATQYTPIVVYTASSSEEQAYALGAAAYIQKPAPLDSVLSTVRAVLGIPDLLPESMAEFDS